MQTNNTSKELPSLELSAKYQAWDTKRCAEALENISELEKRKLAVLERLSDSLTCYLSLPKAQPQRGSQAQTPRQLTGSRGQIEEDIPF